MTIGDAIIYGASVVGAVAAVAGIGWRFVVRPNLAAFVASAFDTPVFREQVGQVVEAKNAQQLRPIMDELSFNGGKSLKDIVVRVDARMDDHINLHLRQGR